LAKYTPMMEQYLQIKAEVPDAFLFFRLGDFYEMFFEDAKLAAKELEITLTGRDAGGEERVPMCGVPYHSAENYIARLIDKGYKVAICEQVEDPAEAKGVVRREIVRIVTPGTIMEDKTLPGAANNFIMSLAEQTGGDSVRRWAAAACDLSTGELYVTEFLADEEQLFEELNTYQPAEVLADETMARVVHMYNRQMNKQTLISERHRSDPQLTERHFPPEELSRLQPASRLSIDRLLSYLYETQKRSLTHIRQIRSYEKQQFMILDPFTRRNLELTETARDRSKKGSLLWLLDKTVTAMGGRLLRRWVDKPLLNRHQIEARQEAVDCLVRQLITREELRQQLREVYDMERLVGRVVYGTANARDLNALKLSLKRVPQLIELAANAGSKTLLQHVSTLDACQDIAAWIEETIVDDPPISVREGGLIKPGCDAKLDQLREASVSGKQWIAELERQERERTGIKSLKIGFNKVFGYYIEVTRANLGALPEGIYERKQTLANAERFITPELKEKEALILEAEEKMVDIEYELFTRLRERIAAETGRLQKLAETIAEIDALQSLAAVSAERRYRRPTITDGYDLTIEAGRHPVVEALLGSEPFIANDTVLSEQDCRMMLITGPNMAGKSTYMRQVAYILIMAQIGCFVPAERAVIPIVDRIFTRIGAADDVIGGQSTFMVEMKDIQLMTAKATQRSLVIIDELGRGTSTGEGMAIAQSVIEFIHHHIGCKTLVSTHFHELAHLEDSLAYLRNYCMDVKESGEEVTFLRKLIRGAASTSYGIYCAKIAGIPETIIERAYQILSTLEIRTTELQSAVSLAQPVQLSLFPDIPLADRRSSDDPCQAREKKRNNDQSKVEKRTSEGDAEGAHTSLDSAATLRSHEPMDTLTASEPAAASVPASAQEIYKRVHEADLMNMTPLQAMQFILELKSIK